MRPGDRRAVAVLVPHQAGQPVVERDRHLVLVRRARLDGARLRDAELAERDAGRVVVGFPDLRRALAEREVVGRWVGRIVAQHLPKPHARLVLRDVQIAVDLEALPGVAVDHRRHHVAVAVGVLRRSARA